jgi:hypothetical protein
MKPEIDYNVFNYNGVIYISKCRKFTILFSGGEKPTEIERDFRLREQGRLVSDYEKWLNDIERFITREKKINKILDETGN